MFISQNNKSDHKFYMKLALKQAKKNLGNTKKNPSVGCVIVNNGAVISLGNTGENGRPHAESKAIDSAKVKLKNSSLYVTLEPCSHFGNTPPCINKIIKNKIKKVFFSINDPDKRSYKKSYIKFKKNRIFVKSNILKHESSKFYKSYIKYKKNGLPFVTAKLAVSKDFYSKNKKNKWLTNEFSRARVHLMRKNHDCILTSSKTIIKDNAKLTCRVNGLEKYSPSLIILDKNLNLSKNLNIFKVSKRRKIVVFFNSNNKKKFRLLKKLKVKLIYAPLNSYGNFDLIKILNKTKFLGYSRIFLESGLNLTLAFLRQNLIDNFTLFISNKKIKKNGIDNFKNYMKIFLRKKRYISPNINLFGDKLIIYRLK